ncbi:hypothetical protein GOBAR_DD35524 [Gossypium barbadense]|nr:hypothetical protein GOBAR_DD35524 [Gossypium barbadense]
MEGPFPTNQHYFNMEGPFPTNQHDFLFYYTTCWVDGSTSVFHLVGIILILVLLFHLIIKLSSRALSQVGLWWNLKHDIHDLKRTVCQIKAVLLDAEEQSVTNNLVKVWLEELKDVFYDADDLLDDFSTEALRKDQSGGNKLTKEVRLFFSSSNQFAYGLKMGRKMKAIKARLASIEREANTFGFIPRDRPAETSFMTKRRQQTHSFEREDDIIGRDDDKAALLKLVLEFQSEENVYIIPIVGFGGLGKTALAQLVYNHEMVKNHFDLTMFVCVSDDFDVKVIVANIIKSVTHQAPDQNLEMDQLQKQLRDKIDGKKYLLVLDDIWNEDPEKWSRLKKLLMGGAKGSRIIVTTRSLRVAEITNKCQSHVLQLKGLSDDDAWSLFKKIAFEQGYADSTNSAFVEVGRQISERCGGGSLSLSHKDDSWYIIFEENYYRIEVQELVQFWIAQGFIKQLNQSQSLEEIGFGYFKDLVERSFFQEVEGITCSQMISPSIYKLKHLRYLDLSWNFNIKILPKSICKIQNLLALKLDWCDGLIELPKKIEKLVNLTHIGCHGCGGLTHMPRGIGKLTSLETLSMFVVDKDGSHGGADLSELRLLNNLRGDLQIRNLGFIKNAKEKFKAANLKEKQHLRSLVLEWSFYFDDNDDDDKSLEDLQPHPNLKELCIRGWRGDAKFPSWLPLLTNLVSMTIDGVNFKQIPSFVQFPCLKWLEIYDCTKLEYMDDNSPKGSQGEPQSFFPSLKHLSLQNCPNMKSWWRTTRPIDDDSNEDDTTVMGTSTMAFPCLSSLEIRNCPLTSMPLYPSLDNKLKLRNTSSRPLKQTMKMNITSTTPSTSTSSLPLSKVKSFYVHNIEGLDTHTLDEWLQHLTSLKTLTIEDCKEVDLEGMQWEPLKNLSCLEIDNFPKLVSLPIGLQHLVQLKTLKICNCKGLRSLLPVFQHLTFLEEFECRHLPEWLQHLVQLKTLKIRNCNGLRSLFPVFQHLTFLEEFEVKDCKELELSGAGIQIFQDHTSLRSLSLKNILKCRHLPEWLQHLTNLQWLYLVNLPNLTSLPDEMRCLTKLKILEIKGIPQLEERCRKDIGADWHKIAHIPHIGLFQKNKSGILNLQLRGLMPFFIEVGYC